MTTPTAAAGSQIVDRSQPRAAVWTGSTPGAVVGTATTYDNDSVSTAVPAAAVLGRVGVRDSHSLPASADGAEQWIGATRAATPDSRADSPDSYRYKVGPGPH
jgi:hypothetical protein